MTIPDGDLAVLHIGDISVTEDGYGVVVRGQPVTLTTAEFRVLWKLAKAGGRAVSVDELKQVGAGMGRPMLQSIKSRIYSLRCKLGDCRGMLETVRDGGYRLVDSESAASALTGGRSSADRQ